MKSPRALLRDRRAVADQAALNDAAEYLAPLLDDGHRHPYIDPIDQVRQKLAARVEDERARQEYLDERNDR